MKNTVHNWQTLGDLAGKVMVCKNAHTGWTTTVGSQRGKDWKAGDVVVILAHQNQGAHNEGVVFFLDGLRGWMSLKGSGFDKNWGIISKPQNKLKGIPFVFTGALPASREYYHKVVELFGGVFGTSITKKTKYLVVADKASRTTKAQKARALGITLIDEPELMALLEKD